MRRVLVGMAIIAAPVMGMTLPARADGGPSGFFATQTPIVDCHQMAIDPPWEPNAVWPVTFHGTINDKPFSRTVDFFSEPGRDATVETADLMAAPGPLRVVVTVDSPQWGTSPTEELTLTCHNRPSASTMPSTAVREPSTVAVEAVNATRTTTAETSTPGASVLAQTAALPRTGSSSSMPLGAIGFGAAGIGSVAMVVGRRRLTRHGVRRA